MNKTAFVGVLQGIRQARSDPAYRLGVWRSGKSGSWAARGIARQNITAGAVERFYKRLARPL